jgi:hypothetical protein
MFAFFGLDPIHWIIIAGLPIAAVVVVVVMSKRNKEGRGKGE